MGCYHFHLNQLSRGKGQSAIASAAYRAGTKLECTYYGEVSDYTRKGGVVLAEIHLPQQAPERFKDRETLWNEVEWIEGNKKAQLAHSFDIALMNEFSMEENIELRRRGSWRNQQKNGEGRCMQTEGLPHPLAWIGTARKK